MTDRKKALERVKAYLAEHDKRAGVASTFDSERIHSLGTKDGQIDLLASDLRALIEQEGGE